MTRKSSRGAPASLSNKLIYGYKAYPAFGNVVVDVCSQFQNRRARTKRKMANSGVTDIKEALGNPERPSFTTLPGPMRAMLEKNAEQKKELAKLKRAAERRERREKEKSKRVKVELKRRWIREENEPPVDWLCPRAQAEKATRDKLKSVRLVPTNSRNIPNLLAGQAQRDRFVVRTCLRLSC